MLKGVARIAGHKFGGLSSTIPLNCRDMASEGDDSNPVCPPQITDPLEGAPPAHRIFVLCLERMIGEGSADLIRRSAACLLISGNAAESEFDSALPATCSLPQVPGRHLPPGMLR